MRNALVNQAGLGAAFGSITGSYLFISSQINGRCAFLSIKNTLDTVSIISLDGGTTDWLFLPPNTSIDIPFGAAGVEYTGRVAVKHNGAAPAAGFISTAVVRFP